MSLQLLILSRIELHQLFTPVIYPLIIMLLPFEALSWVLMLTAFVAGIMVDLYANTLGMHSAATVFMAFIRPYVVRYIEPRLGYDATDRPTLGNMGFMWYLKYTSILILFQQTAFYLLESFRFNLLFNSLLKIVLSSIIFVLLALAYGYLLYDRKNSL
ncbi:MAG: hypothetical protein R2798_00945 [Chitinophagales bacterium]|nr:hypothetical protein [Bacteroidota bacterium]